ncbi:MAG: SDR family oxidoreductase [Lachnospiraceae bacterium]|nr:SDR family oxidoreductase [Lachnospiraceae bacterium]
MRRFLITAADSAFGIALIERMCKTGLEDVEWIYGTYFDAKEQLDELAGTYPELKEKLILRGVDMTDMDEIEKLNDDLEGRDVITDVIHLPAPKAKPLQFKKLSWDVFRANMEISFRSAVLILMKVLPRMAKEKNGKIILMSSYYGTEEGTPNFLAPYVSTKSAMSGLTRALAKEYGGKNIQINAMAPDLTDTKFLDDMPQIMKDTVAAQSERGRMLSAEEVIDVMMELLDETNKENGVVRIVK